MNTRSNGWRSKNLMKMVEDQKEYVLITGASSGIGFQFARLYAKKGENLILIARNKEKLLKAKEALEKLTQSSILCIVKDLSSYTAAEELMQELLEKQYRIHTLINNAGFGYAGEFIDDSYKDQQDMMMCNMTSLVLLTHGIARQMCERKYGKILNVASNGAFQPGPYIATYYATKSFVLQFSLALREELKAYDVFVTTLCPGATISEFAKRAGKQQLAFSMSAEKVAGLGVKGLEKGRRLIVPGWHNRLALLIPERLREHFIKRMYQKKSF